MQIGTCLLSVMRLRFMELLARALNRKVSPYNRKLYKPVTLEVLFPLVSRETPRPFILRVYIWKMRNCFQK